MIELKAGLAAVVLIVVHSGVMLYSGYMYDMSDRPAPADPAESLRHEVHALLAKRSKESMIQINVLEEQIRVLRTRAAERLSAQAAPPLTPSVAKPSPAAHDSKALRVERALAISRSFAAKETKRVVRPAGDTRPAGKTTPVLPAKRECAVREERTKYICPASWILFTLSSRRYSLEECKRYCQQHRHCRGMNYDSSNGACVFTRKAMDGTCRHTAVSTYTWVEC